MGKKKKHKHKKHQFRNAGPRVPRAARPEEETPLRRLAYTAGGAAGTALAGSFLAYEGWAPKTIATALAAVGAGLAWKGDAPGIRSVGAGVMSAAGGQLALTLMADRGGSQSTHAAPTVATAPAKKIANADGLPPGALEGALDRARARFALATGEEGF